MFEFIFSSVTLNATSESNIEVIVEKICVLKLFEVDVKAIISTTNKMNSISGQNTVETNQLLIIQVWNEGPLT